MKQLKKISFSQIENCFPVLGDSENNKILGGINPNCDPALVIAGVDGKDLGYQSSPADWARSNSQWVGDWIAGEVLDAIPGVSNVTSWAENELSNAQWYAAAFLMETSYSGAFWTQICMSGMDIDIVLRNTEGSIMYDGREEDE